MRILCSTILLLTLSGFTRAGEMSPGLRARLLDARPTDRVDAIAYLREPGAPDPAGSGPRPLTARRSRARAAQASLRRYLAGRRAARVRPIWVVNAVAFTAPPDVVRAVTARSDVERVVADGTHTASLPVLARARLSSGSVPWNLERIGTDALWQEGFDGTGVTVGIIDTGIHADHPDLAGRLLPGGWLDAVSGEPTPYDDSGHGTHVAGILCGGDAGGAPIGVAPGARLLAARALDASGRFTLSSILLAGQWMLDPDGDGDPSDAPDIVNCSWTLDGVGADFRPVLEAWRAAGIWPVFAAGNRGPAAYTVTAPACDPLGLAVGMTSTADVVADGSARGPAPAFAPYDGVLKPDLVAPGVLVRSAVPGGYAVASGTSMAAPHVAGALALLKQANPALTYEDAWGRITRAAVDLGAPGPDAAYGHGRLDAHAAVHMPSGYEPPALSGLVRGSGGEPIATALVDAAGTHATTRTDGRFRIPHAASAVTATVDAPGFAPAVVTLAPGVEATVTLSPRIETVMPDSGAEDGTGWEGGGPPGGAVREATANQTIGGAWSLALRATGDGAFRWWLSPPVPVPTDGLASVTVTYAWRAEGDGDGRTSALVWLDGFGREVAVDDGTPFEPSTRGGPSDGLWRTEVQAWRTLPPPGSAWVRLRLGASFPSGDTASVLRFDDAVLDVTRAAGTGVVTGLVTRDGEPVEGAVVGEHPFGTRFAVTDAGGRFVLLAPPGALSLSAWSEGCLASIPRTVTAVSGATATGCDFALESAGSEVASHAAASASQTLDAAHLPSFGADGSVETAWSSPVDGSASPQAPVWWQMDLGAERSMQGAEVLWEAEPAAVRLRASSDGMNWTTLAEGGGAGFRASPAHTLSAFRLPGHRARYLRVETVEDGPAGRTGLWEVRLRVAEEAVPGDADGDGVVSLADVAEALRASGGLADAASVLPRADVVPDGRASVEDASAILRAWAGL